MTKEDAIRIYDSEVWKGWSFRQRAEMQIAVVRLIMPFAVFHEALEMALGRPVWTHELGLNWDGIKSELFDGCDPPSLKEIMDLIPEDKRIIVTL